MLAGIGNIDKVGRYGGARVYIPSKVAFDSALPFKMGEEVKIVIHPETKTLLVVPANDQRNLTVIESGILREIVSTLRALYAEHETRSSKVERRISGVERQLEQLVPA